MSNIGAKRIGSMFMVYRLVFCAERLTNHHLLYYEYNFTMPILLQSPPDRQTGDSTPPRNRKRRGGS